MFRERLYNPSRHQRVELVLSSSVSPMAQAVSGETSVCPKQLHFFPPSSFVKILLHSSIRPPFKKKLHKTIKTRSLVRHSSPGKKQQQKLARREKGRSRLSLATAAWLWRLLYQPRGTGCCRNSKSPPLPPRNSSQALEGLEGHLEFLPAAPAQIPAPANAGSLRGRG